MNAEVKTEDGISVVRLVGEVDLKSSPVLRERLQETLAAKPRGILVDMSGCAYIDSSGIATLVEALQKLRAFGGKLVISGAVQRVKDIFEIAHLDGVFPMFETSDEAKKALR